MVDILGRFCVPFEASDNTKITHNRDGGASLDFDLKHSAGATMASHER